MVLQLKYLFNRCQESIITMWHGSLNWNEILIAPFSKIFEAVKISSPFFETHKVAMETYFRFSNTDVFLPLLSHFDKPKPVFELQNF